MPRRVTNLVGNRYGHLVVVERAGHLGRQVAWLCLCDCGRQAVVRGAMLTKRCEPQTLCSVACPLWTGHKGAGRETVLPLADEGMSATEIAATVGTSRRNVNQILARRRP